MADGRQLAAHPDENLLSAFAEHALTEKEQQSVLEHLSTCAHCRDVVFLAQQAISETAEHREGIPTARAGRRRVWWWSLAATGALATLLIALPVAVYRSRGHGSGAVSHGIASENKVTGPPAPGPVLSANSAVQTAPAEPSVREQAKSLPSAAMNSRAVNGGPAGHAEIAGSVVDRSGAVIPGAQVTVRGAATGTSRSAVTDAQGRFDVAAVAPGEYQVEVSALGFNTLRQPLTVQPSQRASLDAKLDVGSASQSVTVTAQKPGVIGGLETSAGAGNTATGSKLTEQDNAALPMNGRNAASIAPLPTPPAPQASPTPSFAPGAAPQAAGVPPASAPVINGAPPVTTFPVKDGIVQRCVAAECVARALPSSAKAVSTAASAQTVLALDADGNVFLSSDQGEHWSQAKVQWQSKAVSLSIAPDHAQESFFLSSPRGADAVQATHGAVAAKKAPNPVIPATFELTNDKGQVWVSSDEGKSWKPK